MNTELSSSASSPSTFGASIKPIARFIQPQTGQEVFISGNFVYTSLNEARLDRLYTSLNEARLDRLSKYMLAVIKDFSRRWENDDVGFVSLKDGEDLAQGLSELLLKDWEVNPLNVEDKAEKNPEYSICRVCNVRRGELLLVNKQWICFQCNMEFDE